MRQRNQLAEMNEMIRELVSAEALSSPAGVAANDVISEDELTRFEGIWQNQHGGFMYAQIINGKLRAPYCYEGNHHLDSEFSGWKHIGEYWYTRFRWFDLEISGYALFKFVSNEEFSGKWWYSAATSPKELVAFDENRPEGNNLQWIRVFNGFLPPWASEYFEKARKEDTS